MINSWLLLVAVSLAARHSMLERIQAATFTETPAAAADAGCELLNKPVKPAALRALIASLLGRRDVA